MFDKTEPASANDKNVFWKRLKGVDGQVLSVLDASIICRMCRTLVVRENVTKRKKKKKNYICIYIYRTHTHTHTHKYIDRCNYII